MLTSMKSIAKYDMKEACAEELGHVSQLIINALFTCSVVTLAILPSLGGELCPRLCSLY